MKQKKGKKGGFSDSQHKDSAYVFYFFIAPF